MSTEDAVSSERNISEEVSKPSRCLPHEIHLEILLARKSFDLNSYVMRESILERLEMKGNIQIDEYLKLCKLHDQALFYYDRHESVAGNKERVHEIVSDLTDFIESSSFQWRTFRRMNADLLIRYRIRDKDLYNRQVNWKNTNLCDPFQEIIFNQIMESEENGVIDCCSLLNLQVEFCGEINSSHFSTMIFLSRSNFLTSETEEKLVMIADEGEDRKLWNKLSVEVRFKDMKKYEKEIPVVISRLIFRDEVENLLNITNHPDLSETSKLQIFAHWFFVDGLGYLSEIASTEYFIRICLEYRYY
jgi:hypothetical protein